MSNCFAIYIRDWLDENEEPGLPHLKNKVDFMKELITFETAFEAGSRPSRFLCAESDLDINRVKLH